MKNVDLKVDEKKKVLTIEIDLTKDFGPSESGKTVIVGTTGAAQEIPGFPGFKIGINCYKKPGTKAGK